MTELHLLRPWWLVALLPLALLVWRVAKPGLERAGWYSVCDPHLFSAILHQPQQRLVRFMPWLIAIPGCLLVVAMAGPVWQRLPQPVITPQSAVILILDLSQSMDATDIKPSRLARAKHKVMDLLRRHSEGQTALLVFARDAFVVTPLTTDTATIVAQLSSLDTALMPTPGSRPDRAVHKAHELLRRNDIAHGRTILITDEWQGNKQVVQELVVAGHTLSILGVGSTAGAPIPLVDGGFLEDDTGVAVIAKLDQTHLHHLATLGGGRYQSLRNDDRDIEQLLAAPLVHPHQANRINDNILTDVWYEEGPWFVLMALPLIALAWRRGVLLVLLLLVFPETTQAWDWDALWQRPEQQAMQLLQSGQAKQAAELFQDREWRAVALYQSGQYQQVVDTLQGSDSIVALYNKGNALAKLGNLETASQAFAAVLQRQPDHGDARYNLEQINQILHPAGLQSAPGSTGQAKTGTQPVAVESSLTTKAAATRTRQEGVDPLASSSPQSGGRPVVEQRGDGADLALAFGQIGDRQTRRQEMQLASQQWLRRVPDDPGGLLRRKFRYQYQLDPGRFQTESPLPEEHPW